MREILGTVPKNHQSFGDFGDCIEFHEHETNYNLFNYCFFILGLDIREAIYPKNTAAAIPPAAAAVPPVKAPTNPISLTFCMEPFASRLPNPVKGTVAPAPAKSTKCLYIPSPP